MTVNATRSAIVATGLGKSFGDHVVLDGIELNIAEGTVFALLGPNGSGKTTTVQILSTLLPADAGTARVAGHDLNTDPGLVRAAIGVTGQFSAVDNLLTGQENLLLMADLHHLDRAEGRRRAAGLLDRFDLAGAAGKTAATYSGGMRRRLDLAMTLVGEPRIIFLDEPTTGLDPRSRRTMWQIIRDLVADGVTIFLTTQYLEEADQLADRIAVLDHGKLVAEGTPGELKRLIPGGHIELHFGDASGLDSAARVLGEASRDEDALTLQVAYEGSVRSLKALLDRLDEQAKTPAGANSLSLLPAFLPFISSAFIPIGSMSGGVRWFAANEPFTPVIDTLRGLLTGTGIGNSAVLAAAWCAGMTLAGYLWARALYNRRPAR